MRGKLIVLKGLTGAARRPKQNFLWNALTQEGYAVKKLRSWTMKALQFACQNVSGGDFGTDAESVKRICRFQFLCGRPLCELSHELVGFLSEWWNRLADRYTTSNAVHQCAKLPKEQWDEYLYWLFDFEYNKIGIPKPDQVIYLDVDPDVSQKLLTKR